MIRSWTIFMIFSLAHCSLVSATNYYVSNTNGNDSNVGKTVTSAWKTISKVNGKTFLPGDSILFKKGDLWRETLEVSSSGTIGKYLYFGNYGTGVNPRILGSAISSGWTDQGGNIWRSNSTFVNPRNIYPQDACDISFDKSGTITWAFYKPNTGSLASEFDWTWSGNYIYIYAASNPSARYTSVEIPQRQFGVSTNNKEYLHFNRIDVFYCADTGYDTNADHSDHTNIRGCILENSEIGYIGGTTTNQFGFGTSLIYSDLIIRYCNIHHCGRRGCSLDIIGAGAVFTARNALIENNIYHHGSHTTSLDCNVNNGGNGASWDSIVFRNNLIYEPETTMPYASNQIFLQQYPGSGSLGKVYIYNNIFKFTGGYGIAIERTASTYIYNNTFYGHNTSVSPSYHIYADTDPQNITIKNNLFYTLLSNDNQGNGAEVVLYGVDKTEVNADYNLYYRINNAVRIVLANGASYYMNNRAAIISNLGWETNGVFADPLFVSTSDFHLLDSSPAIGKGIPVKFIRKDFDGEFFNNPPSIGAFEGKKGYIPPDIPPDTTGHQELFIIYPNPSHGYLTIVRDGSALATQKIRIVNMAGKIVIEDFLEEGVKNKQIPAKLNAGIYVVQVFSGNLTTNTQKIIVINF